MVDYYLIINTTGVVPDEDWIRVFQLIREEVVGSDSFIKIEFGELDDEEDREGAGLPADSGDSTVF